MSAPTLMMMDQQPTWSALTDRKPLFPTLKKRMHTLPTVELRRPKTCQLITCVRFAVAHGFCDSHSPSNSTVRQSVSLPSIRWTSPTEFSISNLLDSIKKNSQNPQSIPATVLRPQPLPALPSLLRNLPTATTAEPSVAAPGLAPLSIAASVFRPILTTPPNASSRRFAQASPSQSPGSNHRTSVRKDRSCLTKPVVQCRRDQCTNPARRKGLCMEHGGRHFCKMDGCQKCAHRGGFCIAHGGGRRCAVENCTKSAQSGGICYSHGGGKRCAMDHCSQAARSGGYCTRHGKQLQERAL